MFEVYKVTRALPFMANAKPWFSISVIAVLIAVAGLAFRGLNLGIDFTGGTVIEVTYPEPIEVNTVREKLATVNMSDAIVQNFGTARDVLIRIPVKPEVTSAQVSEVVLKALREREPKVEMKRVEFVGPQVGSELLYDGLLALIDACDVVITTSNVTAHLAGSIGKKAVVLVPAGKGCLWYWQGGSNDLWYPSLTRLAQQRVGDWGGAIAAASAWLKDNS